MNEKKRKPINVSLRVIADLSQGLYRTPADALKELVSNAYDADSKSVKITFSRDFSTLTIHDEGSGMSIDKFIETMETIGGSSKRSADDKNDITESGRKIVGRIGIGLLSVSQIASALEIESTTEGSTIGFHAEINFDQFASDTARKIRITDLYENKKQIEIGRYEYTELRGLAKEDHYTTLTLSNFNRTIQHKLRGQSESDGYERKMGIDFQKIEELIGWMNENKIIKTALHEYDRIFWELCALSPVPYLKQPLTVLNPLVDSDTTEDFNSFAKQINSETHFRLFFDNIECFKPILMPSELDKSYGLFFNQLFMDGLNNTEVSYLDYDTSGELVEKKMKIKGYFYFQRPKVWPPELQGVIIRVRNVAVGPYDSTFLTYRRHEGFKFSQITGEIVVDELDNALNIDRSSFRETAPSFIKLRDTIHNYLAGTVFPGIKSLAADDRKERNLSWIEEEKIRLVNNSKKVKGKYEEIDFSAELSQILKRDSTTLLLASSLEGRKIKYDTTFYRVLVFLESYLSRKLNQKERDELYESLFHWWKEFE